MKKRGKEGVGWLEGYGAAADAVLRNRGSIAPFRCGI